MPCQKQIDAIKKGALYLISAYVVCFLNIIMPLIYTLPKCKLSTYVLSILLCLCFGISPWTLKKLIILSSKMQDAPLKIAIPIFTIIWKVKGVPQ